MYGSLEVLCSCLRLFYMRYSKKYLSHKDFMSKKFVIIGTSAAGLAVLNTIRRLDKQAEIICISQEAEFPYNKCLIADYVAGIKTVDEVHTLTREKIDALSSTLLLNTQVVAIDPQARTVTTDNGQSIQYTSLFLGTGSRPVQLPLTWGRTIPGLFTFHTLHDVNAMMAYVKERGVRNAVVIGSGLSGLECADALLQHGVRSTVVEKNDRVLLSAITPAGSRCIQEAMRTHGITFLSNTQVVDFEYTGQALHGVVVDNGTRIAAEMVIVAIGVVSNTHLAVDAGVLVRNNSIEVNEYMQTSAEHIYAGGDVCSIKDNITGQLVASRTWPDAMQQGMVAAHNMLGIPKIYPGASVITSSAFFGIKLASCGPITAVPEGWQLLEQGGENFQHAFLLDGDRLKGFALVGNTTHVSAYKRLVLTGQSVVPEQLFVGF
jgi:NAD(P)H-nitrite reductase large subunit